MWSSIDSAQATETVWAAREALLSFAAGMASLALASDVFLVSAVVTEPVVPTPLVVLAEGAPPAADSSSVMEAPVAAEKSNMGEFHETSGHPSMDKLKISQYGSKNKTPMVDIKVFRNKKKGRKRVIIDQTLVKNTSDDDLMRVTQTKKYTDSGQKNKSKKANKEVPVSTEPDSDLLQLDWLTLQLKLKCS